MPDVGETSIAEFRIRGHSIEHHGKQCASKHDGSA